MSAHTRRRIAVGATGMLLAAGLTGCVSVSADPTPSPSPTELPDLVGVWTGSYVYPNQDGTVTKSEETIEVTKQDGKLLWGRSSWRGGGDDGGLGFVGSLVGGGHEVVLADNGGGFFTGTTDGATMELVFTRTDDENTVFTVTLRREPTQ